MELRRGQALSERQLVDRLNDLGYAERATPGKPGEFSVDADAWSRSCRARGENAGQTVRASLQRPARRQAGRAAAAGRASGSSGSRSPPSGPKDTVTLDPPLLTSLMSGEREKRRQVRLGQIPPARGQRGAGHRRPPVLRAPGHRSDPDGRRARHQPHAASGRTSSAAARSPSSSSGTSSSPRSSPTRPRNRCAARSPSSSWRSCSSGARRRTRSSSST